MVSTDSSREQIERVLQSDTFRSSEVLRRLLRFLSEKSLSGQADQLKEYVIGLDALGKSPDYDPRQDSVVRIQVGRLRQKLAEYYRKEGTSDPVVVDLPKGHFSLQWALRDHENGIIAVVKSDPEPESPPTSARSGRTVQILAAALAASMIWGGYVTTRLVREQAVMRPVRAMWTPEVEELWLPVLNSNRPLIISVAAPLFVGLQGSGLYRDLSLNSWEDALNSPHVGAIRHALKDPAIFPTFNYTGFGNLTGVFQLGKLLGIRIPNISVMRSDRLSWQQVVDDNVVFVGPPRLYTEQLRSLPLEPEFDLDETGIRNRHPLPGEPATLADNFRSIRRGNSAAGGDDGELYALITHTPGPLGSGEIECFNSNHSPGTRAAVEAFTNPTLAQMIIGKLRKSDGKIPRYYQVVLKSKYKDGVPTDIAYVMHRELRLQARKPVSVQ